MIVQPSKWLRCEVTTPHGVFSHITANLTSCKVVVDSDCVSELIRLEMQRARKVSNIIDEAGKSAPLDGDDSPLKVAVAMCPSVLISQPALMSGIVAKKNRPPTKCKSGSYKNTCSGAPQC